MAKKIALIVAVLLIGAGAAAFFYRYTLLQYSAEKIIRSMLPAYVHIEKMEFDVRQGRIAFKGIAITNPPGFSDRTLIDIEEFSCRYAIRGKQIFDGVALTDAALIRPVVHIERRADGVTNLAAMQTMLHQAPALAAPASQVRDQGLAEMQRRFGNKKISSLIVLPSSIAVSEGTIYFIDRAVSGTAAVSLSLEAITGTISLALNDSYTQVTALASEGSGIFNRDRAATIRWKTGLNPTTEKLTMSNRFVVSHLPLTVFAPYYDPYSPLVFTRGFFSGTLVFDFDNGNIGSTNEITLSDIVFYIKQKYENAQFWETTVPALAKYFATSSGDVIFDFKIKGEMEHPRFYLGPISKQALTSMAVDTISGVIQEMAKPKSATAAGSSDIDKAKEYVDLFKSLIKK